MDQLHEELKQPVPSMEEDPDSSDSDDDEPNHHNKRLLGGTSLPHKETLQDGIALDYLHNDVDNSRSQGRYPAVSMIFPSEKQLAIYLVILLQPKVPAC